MLTAAACQNSMSDDTQAFDAYCKGSHIQSLQMQNVRSTHKAAWKFHIQICCEMQIHVLDTCMICTCRELICGLSSQLGTDLR